MLAKILLLTVTMCFTSEDSLSESTLDYNRDIKPIIVKNCLACHGPDAAARKSPLRLDSRESAIKKRGTKAPAIIPGKPQSSELIARVTSTDADLKMPPPDSGHELTLEQITKLKRWIEAGAIYSEHWAYVAPRRPSTPTVQNQLKNRRSIDSFILSRLESAKLGMESIADRSILLRRLSLDLRGIPPSPAEIYAFQNDATAMAYERAVDRFLADPAYGERWARVWLDLARYADSAGYGSDPLRTIWRYRDWVIDAFNSNMPFDDFTRRQLAGDLLPNADDDARLATAFHRNTMTNTEGGTDDEEFRVAAVKDRVDTTMQVWMGLTAGCAKCHNHKFDPLSIEEYYKLFAVFNQSADADLPGEEPVIASPDFLQRQLNSEIDAKIAGILRGISKPNAKIAAQLVLPRSLMGSQPNLAAIVEIVQWNKKRPVVATVPVMVELGVKKGRKTHVLEKGNHLTPGAPVEPGFPAAFHSVPIAKPINRAALSDWIMHPANPLTARVAVNRIWAQVFGVGLVESEEDFGSQGEWPSHKELLDWLAVEYRESGWDTKALLRKIVTSHTYMQSSHVSENSMRKDPKARLLSRFPRIRLEAEMVRDQALQLAGLLSRNLRGPSVFPPQPDGLWQAAFNGQRTWKTSTGTDRYRRGIYVFWRRTIPYPSMATFDAPSRETCTIRRSRTNTPLQAFVTLNDPVYVEAAQALAGRITKEGGLTVQSRARFGLTLATCREPSTEQVHLIVDLYNRSLERYNKSAEDALLLHGKWAISGAVSLAEAAAWTVVANVLLNLDSVLTRG